MLKIILYLGQAVRQRQVSSGRVSIARRSCNRFRIDVSTRTMSSKSSTALPTKPSNDPRQHSRDNQFNRSGVRFGVEDNGNGLGFIGFITGNNTAAEVQNHLRRSTELAILLATVRADGRSGFRSGQTSSEAAWDSGECDAMRPRKSCRSSRTTSRRSGLTSPATSPTKTTATERSLTPLKENVVDLLLSGRTSKRFRSTTTTWSRPVTTTRRRGPGGRQVSTGLVNDTPDRDEEGNDLGTVTKSVNYSVLYLKAVKALRAMKGSRPSNRRWLT